MGLTDNWWTVIIVLITVLFAVLIRTSTGIMCAQATYEYTTQQMQDDSVKLIQNGSASTELMAYKQMSSGSL